MATIMACGEEAAREGMREQPTSACCTTTLYDLMAVLQEVVGPVHHRLVVATGVHWLQAGHITWNRLASAPPSAGPREAAWARLTRAHGSPVDTGRAVPTLEEDLT